MSNKILRGDPMGKQAAEYLYRELHRHQISKDDFKAHILQVYRVTSSLDLTFSQVKTITQQLKYIPVENV